MEITVYNPQKGRLEAIEVEYSPENTTWFDNYTDNSDIYMITDFEGGLLIKDYDYSYPRYVYDISRAEIDYDRAKAKEIALLYIDY
jgi:hypothetical protein